MWNWRRQSDEDFAEEIQTHISQEMKRLVEEEGLDFQEARRQALRSFGNVAHAQERFYESERFMWLENLTRDVMYALRSFWRNKAFAAIGMMTIALGIGANAAIFSVVNAVLLKPLPYLDPDRLVRFAEITPASATPNGRERRSGAISVTELLELRSRAKTVSHVSFSGGGGLGGLLLIRLFQHATICSVGACRARRFRRICATFSVNSLPKRPASGIWLRVAGRRVSDARAVDTGVRTPWRSGAGNVPNVGIRYR